jgi:hypothetical protein
MLTWRRSLLTLCALLVSGTSLRAQPAVDLSGSIAVNFIDNCPRLVDGDTCEVLPGWSTAAGVHVAPPLVIVGEVNRFGGSLDYPPDGEAHGYGFMAGPRITWGRKQPLRPFAQFLAGVVRTTGSSVDLVFSGDCTDFSIKSLCQSLRLPVTSWSTDAAFQPGAGLDIGPASSRFAVRVTGDMRVTRRSDGL